MSEQDALLILNAIPGLGNRRIRALLECFGSPKAVLSLSGSQLQKQRIVPQGVVDNITQFPQDQFLAWEYKLIKKHNIHVIGFEDDDYPQSLQEIPDGPVVLYVKGVMPTNINQSMAIVGSRRASIYGIMIANQFASRLSDLGLVIVSGLAKGIDAAAHQGCLTSGGSTLAVLGCGLSHIYPLENKRLYDSIPKRGAIISEFPMERTPMAYNFPRRNRIISGLSLGVIIVEAAAKSGALITADFALEQGKEVYAVPGKIDSPTSKGVHTLLKQGAKLVTGIEDILEDLSTHLRITLGESQTCDQNQDVGEKLVHSGLSDQENFVYNYINERPIHIDELTGHCGLPISGTASILLQLELKRLVKQLPGKFFTR